MFEASYNALPVITVAWGGQNDFLYMPVKNKKGKVSSQPMFTSVRFDIKPVQREAVWEHVIPEDSMWSYAVEWHYKKCLNEVYKNHGAAKSKARKLQKYLKENFTQEIMYKKFVDSIYKEEEYDVESWLDSLGVEAFG